MRPGKRVARVEGNVSSGYPSHDKLSPCTIVTCSNRETTLDQQRGRPLDTAIESELKGTVLTLDKLMI